MLSFLIESCAMYLAVGMVLSGKLQTSGENGMCLASLICKLHSFCGFFNCFGRAAGGRGALPYTKDAQHMNLLSGKIVD